MTSAPLATIFRPISTNLPGTDGEAPEAIAEEEFVLMAQRIAKAIDAKLRAIESRNPDGTPASDHADARTLALLTATLQKLNVVLNERIPRRPLRLPRARETIERRFFAELDEGAEKKVF